MAGLLVPRTAPVAVAATRPKRGPCPADEAVPASPPAPAAVVPTASAPSAMSNAPSLAPARHLLPLLITSSFLVSGSLADARSASLGWQPAVGRMGQRRGHHDLNYGRRSRSYPDTPRRSYEEIRPIADFCQLNS